MRRSVSFFGVLAVIACAPTAGQLGSEALAPGIAASPIEVCVDRTLADSPLVDASFDSERHWGFRRKTVRSRSVRMMNPPGPRIRNLSLTIESPDGTPRSFVVEYFSPGQGGMQPAADPKLAELEREAVGEIAAQLLRDVRNECMPKAVSQPTCVTLSQSSTGRCTIGM